jgi:hypothetical protein
MVCGLVALNPAVGQSIARAGLPAPPLAIAACSSGQTATAEWVVLVLESRLPPGNLQPQTRMQTDVTLSYTVKLLKDCGAIR